MTILPIHKATSTRFEQCAAKHANVVERAVGGVGVVAELLGALEVNVALDVRRDRHPPAGAGARPGPSSLCVHTF